MSRFALLNNAAGSDDEVDVPQVDVPQTVAQEDSQSESVSPQALWLQEERSKCTRARSSGGLAVEAKVETPIEGEEQIVDESYTLTPELIASLSLCNGSLAKWDAVGDDGVNPGKKYNKLWVPRLTCYASALAFSAALDQLKLKHEAKPTRTDEIILAAFAASPFPAAARAVLRAGLHEIFLYSTDIVTDSAYFINLTEQKTKTQDANLWTLAKVFYGQLFEAIYFCFHYSKRGCTLRSNVDSKKNAPAKIGKAGNKVKSTKLHVKKSDEDYLEDAKFVSIETAQLNGHTSLDLVEALATVMPSFNAMKERGTDFSEAYRLSSAAKKEFWEGVAQQKQERDEQFQKEAAQKKAKRELSFVNNWHQNNWHQKQNVLKGKAAKVRSSNPAEESESDTKSDVGADANTPVPSNQKRAVKKGLPSQPFEKSTTFVPTAAAVIDCAELFG